MRAAACNFSFSHLSPFAPSPKGTLRANVDADAFLRLSPVSHTSISEPYTPIESVLYYIEVKKYAQICKIKVKFCVFKNFFTQTAPKAAIILPHNGKMLHANGRAALKKVNYASRAPFKLHFFCI